MGVNSRLFNDLRGDVSIGNTYLGIGPARACEIASPGGADLRHIGKRHAGTGGATAAKFVERLAQSDEANVDMNGMRDCESFESRQGQTLA